MRIESFIEFYYFPLSSHLLYYSLKICYHFRIWIESCGDFIGIESFIASVATIIVIVIALIAVQY